MTYYVQRRGIPSLGGGSLLETVDECSSVKEARSLLVEYQLFDSSARYYLSTRCCRAWRNRSH